MKDVILDIEDLCVHYGKKQILKDIKYSFENNKITAIIGASGCGKSTFLKSLNRTIQEYGGQICGNIFLNKENIFNVSLENLRKSIGIVFQHPIVFPFSVYKNLTYAPIYFGEKNRENLDKIVIKYLKKSGLHEEVKDNLNISALKLSGGQQQRLAIARCLTVNPKIILLDEPCSALDIKNTAHIEKLLLELKNELTIIIVTHNLAQAKRIADNVIYMEDGQIIETGTAISLFENPEDYRTKEYFKYMKD